LQAKRVSPWTTEAERLVVQRVGQNLFRDGLLGLWEEQCAVANRSVPSRAQYEGWTNHVGWLD
jgi:hypothetical protein